jgi:aryl-alcohol dehydrogenase-like predicted oxidoreductase
VQQVRLGRSGLVVSRLAFGTWQLGGDWGPTDTAGAMGAIRRAVDEGVTFFDTAQAYGFGQSEQLLSAALRVVPREQVIIATKGGLRPTDGGLVRDARARWIREGVDASLRALGTDYVDLYQLHWPDPATPFDETAAALARLIAEGKIRHAGVSNFDVEQMETFGVTLPAETLQAPYDLFRRDIEAEVLPYTEAHDIGVLVCGPLAHGLLSGSLGPGTRFARDDWRSRSLMFAGETYAAICGWWLNWVRWRPNSGSRCPSWRSPGHWPIRPSTLPSWAPAIATTSTRLWRRTGATSTMR